jgi:hypothetical protein
MMKALQLKIVSFSLLTLFLTTISCRSTEESINDTTTVASALNVKIKLSGIETIEETPALQASANKKEFHPEIFSRQLFLLKRYFCYSYTCT